MFPIIRKTSRTYEFDSRLQDDELSLFQGCIGSVVGSLLMKNASFGIQDRVEISTYGPLIIQFGIYKNKQINVCMTSLFHETHGPIVDQGGLLVQRIESNWQKESRENILTPPHTIDSSFVVNVKYPIHHPLKSIDFYGNSETGDVRELDKDIDITFLKTIGYDEFPEVQCNSIEFVVINHSNGTFSIISIDKDGFWLNLNIREPFSRDIIDKSYVHVNGYKKNIVLQHSIVC